MSDERYGKRTEREREREEPGLFELVDLVSRRLVTGIAIAGGLVAFALWTQDTEAPDYQIAASADGRVYRVNTESGWIVGCEGKTCEILLDDETDLRAELPRRVREALPPPAEQPKGGSNEAAAAGNGT